MDNTDDDVEAFLTNLETKLASMPEDKRRDLMDIIKTMVELAQPKNGKTRH